MSRVFTAMAGLFLAIVGLAVCAPAQAQMYWRLDTGWSVPNDAEFKVRSCPICLRDQVDEVDDSYILGGGIGYRFNPSLRGDVTLGYRGGYGLSGGPFAPNTQYRGDITSTVVMASGYYDFSASSVRPYIGAGIGWAQNKLDSVVQTFPNVTTTMPGGKKSNAAFALMAGVGIPVSGWILDIGYRYVDLGKIVSAPGTGTTTASSPLTGFTSTLTFDYQGAEGKLTAHELTIGVRF